MLRITSCGLLPSSVFIGRSLRLVIASIINFAQLDCGKSRSMRILATAFASSAFKTSFDSQANPEFQDELLGAVRKLILGYCEVHGLPEEKGKIFFKQVLVP